MVLTHRSANPVVFNPNYNVMDQDTGETPFGLWFEVKSSVSTRTWGEFLVESGMDFWFGLEVDWDTAEIVSPVWEYRVELVDEHNLLILDSPEALRALHSKYGVVVDDYMGEGEPPMVFIDWAKVQSDGYWGVILSPYDEDEMRRDSIIRYWYSGFDCDSGCIWDNRAIKSFQLTYAR